MVPLLNLYSIKISKEYIMSELLLEASALALGPKIAIVDDNEADALPLEKELNTLSISNHFYNVNLIDPKYPEQPLKDVEIVFMDLYFVSGFGASFDPYLCVEWLKRIVPDGQKYILVVWSRDADDHTNELLDVMARVNITMPYLTDSRTKQNYRRQEDNTYDVHRLLNDIGRRVKEIPTTTYDYIGQVLEVDEVNREILINCLLNEDNMIFEVRRFDLQLFDNFLQPQPEQFIRIRITNKPGSSTLDFFEEKTDYSEKFVKRDPQGLDDMDWPNIPDHENYL